MGALAIQSLVGVADGRRVAANVGDGCGSEQAVVAVKTVEVGAVGAPSPGREVREGRPAGGGDRVVHVVGVRDTLIREPVAVVVPAHGLTRLPGQGQIADPTGAVVCV